MASGWAENRRSHSKQGGVHAIFITSVGVAFAHVGRSHMARQTLEKERTVARTRSVVSFLWVLVARYRFLVTNHVGYILVNVR